MKPQPKKILMVLDREFPPDLRVENEMESLLKKGVEVHLACYTREGKSRDDRWQQARIFRKPISTFFYKSSVGALKFPFYFNFWRSFLDRLCRENQYDAIHVHDLPLARVGYELKTKYGMPLVLDLHENWPALLDIAEHTQGLLGKLLSSARQWRDYEKEYCRKADRVIVVVDEARERLAGLGIDRRKIFVVSNTLNLEHFRGDYQEPAKDELILFYAGGLNYHRGLQVVIKALSMVKHKPAGLKFWVLGEGRYRKTLEEMVKDLEIKDKVIFFGQKPYTCMLEFLSKCHYALIPHLKSEHTDSTIPHKLFQYLFAGKPVIASDCTPISRIIHEGNCGYIYRDDQPGKLAEIIDNLDPKRDKDLSTNGKRLVTAKYTWDRDAATLLAIYHSLQITTS
ncbi:MAG TPA: glycosyltransferase WbuB [Bacteroidetes bacterium]|nr:glycosyltransferase WbuB [Bacteroidota bacterium]